MIRWPGPGPEADLLVLQHVLGKDVSSATRAGSKVVLAPGILEASRLMLPAYTTNHCVAVSHIMEPFEDDGWFFVVTNLGGTYTAKLRRGGVQFEGQSRTHAAEAICMAALRAKGLVVHRLVDSK